MMRIALVEDEAALREILVAYLRREGWDVTAFGNVRGAWAAREEDFHLWILDLMLPDGNGFELLKGVRQTYPKMPVIMISARDQDLDRVIGLEMGSDDYLPKPFLPQELLIRAKRLLERVYGSTSDASLGSHGVLNAANSGEFVGNHGNSNGNGTVSGNGHAQGSVVSSAQGTLQLEPYVVDAVRRCVWLNDEMIDLTTKEFDLMLTFAQHRGQAFSREQLLYRVWGDDFFGSDRVVDDLVRRLRRKCPELRLETMYGFGYRAV
jgi:two-component system, OmpR family, response regulator CssR